MNSAAILEGARGFSLGFSFIESHQGSKEVRQGRNYHLAAASQSWELISLAMLGKKIAEHASSNPPPRGLNRLLVAATVCLIPFNLLAAHAKTYPERFSLPLIGSAPQRVLSFYATHSESLYYLAFIVETVALFYLGQAAYAAPLLAMVAYEKLSFWLLPPKVNLFLEKTLPLICSFGLLTEGGILLPLLGAIELASYFLPFVQNWLSYKTDLLGRLCLSFDPDLSDKLSEVPSLPEWQAPLLEKRNLSMRDAEQILLADSGDYEINPAHCSKPIFNPDELAEDRAFEKLIDMFDQYAWEREYEVTKRKLRDDDRFLDELREAFPNEDVKKDFDVLLSAVAQKKAQSNEAYCANWCREQMALFVQGLKGNRRAEGSMQDLNTAQQQTAKVVSYLSKLKDDVQKKDLLLKLAIEAGGYCSLGLARVANEIVSQISSLACTDKESSVDLAPQTIYERQLFEKLQNQRLRCVNAEYNKIIRKTPVLSGNSSDVHLYDYVFTSLSMGFYPPLQPNKIPSANEVLNANVYFQFRYEILKEYKKYLDNKLINDLKNLDFSDYIIRLITSLSNLSEEEKGNLTHRFTSPPEESPEESKGLFREKIKEHNQAWLRLVLVVLGVLRPKNGRNR